ncbi:DUF305 domain-containing protein [Nonomuraea sp. NPDC049400]|uniref:DUF305 domain-containing protein n=1 Tax=Nonomuraea sp. NPDC049400 TaxID=3364352 RepID=UPI0037908B3D
MMITSATTRGISLATSLAAGTAILAACGSVTAGQDMSALPKAAPAMTAISAQPSPDVNEADVRFAQMMIRHHQQAIEMAELAEKRASDKEVKELAEKIKAAQEPEIETMKDWLQDWGRPMPTDGMGPDMPGPMPTDGRGPMPTDGRGPMPTDEMGRGMPGSMSDEDMRRLEATTGSVFDKEFLRMMIAHHQGAIAMARTEQQRGRNPQAKQLAGKIVTDQRTEVERMQKTLDRLQ